MKADHKLNEECAVFGVSISGSEAAGITYNALLSMQHRGQEGSGIAVVSDNTIQCSKHRGLVGEVFTNETLSQIPPSGIAVGHNRYSTTGGTDAENVQPFVTEYLTGRIATVHNGNLTNTRELREHLLREGLCFKGTSDSEVISSLIAYCIIKAGDVEEGVKDAAELLEGAFSLAVMSGDGRLIIVRDSDGFRPLCIGKNEHGMAVASESCAFDSCGFHFLRDVEPGELLVIEQGQITGSRFISPARKTGCGLCIFEYVYFARPDSVLDGLSVTEARYQMGRALAEEYPVEADIVCGVPDSGLEAAAGYSAQSQIPLVTGFVKNRYIGRSFIYPTKTQRESAVRLKLNPLSVNVAGKRLVLVDDSIVRGTTSRKIVSALKEAGAKEVHMRISSPPFRYTCYYGTDIDSEENLIANKMSVEEICQEIGADSLGFISIKGLKTACAQSARPFCTSCFSGYHYKKKGKKAR